MTKKWYENGRRNFLLALSSTFITACLNNLDNQNLPEQIPQSKSLKKLAIDKGIFYGSYVEGEYKNFFTDTEFQTLFIQECSLLVVGFQWTRIYQNANNFEFADTDKLVKFAVDNKILLRGQPLIYHQFQPQWLIDKFKNPKTTSEQIQNILVNSLSTIVNRYAGQINSWVVVNEAINIGDGRTDGLRDTTVSNVLSNNGWGKYPTWLNFLGADYIDLAFRTAAQVDPQAMLVYNENRLCYDIPEHEGQRFAVLKLLKHLKAQNTPIHALGIQSHLIASQNKFFNPKQFSKFLQDVANIGLKIIISELDVSDRDLPRDIQTRDRLVAEAYSNFLSVALNEPAVIAVTTWGLSDRYTWLSWQEPRSDNLPVRPLPYDDKLQPKLAYKAIVRALSDMPQRNFSR